MKIRPINKITANEKFEDKYSVSLLDTPFTYHTPIIGSESNDAVSILEECSLLIFQPLFKPA